MQDAAAPNVGHSLAFVHHVITRALGVIAERGREFADKGFPSPAVRTGFVRYARCVVTCLDAHSLIEDEIAMPALEAKVPTAPYDDMERDHRRMEPILQALTPYIDRIESESNPKTALQALVTYIIKLQALWLPHIETEEKHFSAERLAEAMSEAEHAALVQQFAAASQKHAKPDYLIVPFMLFNLEPTERARFSSGLPATLVERLVPETWRAHWEPMTPFLLT
jgi:hypothetical protein